MSQTAVSWIDGIDRDAVVPAIGGVSELPARVDLEFSGRVSGDGLAIGQ